MKYVRADVQTSLVEELLNYKNVSLLLNYVNYFGKIKKSYYKGISRRQQNKLSNAIKKARHMGLLSFVR